MLHPWIKIKDVLDLIEDMQRIDGMISKRDFQKALLKCREYKQPLEKIEKIKSYKVRNAHEIIGNIQKYKRDFKDSHIIEMLQSRKKMCTRKHCDCWNFNGIDFTNDNVKLYIPTKQGEMKKIDIKDSVLGAKYMSKIMGISESTFLRWSKNGIIDWVCGGIFIKSNSYDYFCIVEVFSLTGTIKNIKAHR